MHVTFSHAGSGNFVVQLVPADGSFFGGAESKGVVEKLRDLAALRDDGIISSEEFEAKKAELMAAF